MDSFHTFPSFLYLSTSSTPLYAAPSWWSRFLLFTNLIFGSINKGLNKHHTLSLWTLRKPYLSASSGLLSASPSWRSRSAPGCPPGRGWRQPIGPELCSKEWPRSRGSASCTSSLQARSGTRSGTSPRTAWNFCKRKASLTQALVVELVATAFCLSELSSNPRMD